MKLYQVEKEGVNHQCVVHRLQGEGEDQYWPFILGLFAWEQLLDVLKVFGVCEDERLGWYRAL